MKISNKKAAVRYYIIASIVSIALAVGLLYFAGINPFSKVDWRKIGAYLNKTKTLPEYWIYGITGWLFLTFS